MEKNISAWALVVALTLSLWFAATPVAWAHDGQPRLELSAERTRPGADLEVRGINIAPELQITLALVGGGAEFPLGVVVGDAHGDFVQAIAVPRETVAGAYHVRAFGANRVVVAAPLTIVGMAQEEEGEQREQDEPLLAPMPGPNLATQPQAAARPRDPQAAVAVRSEDRSASMLPALFAAGGLAVVVLVVLAMRWRAGRGGEGSEECEAKLPG